VTALEIRNLEIFWKIDLHQFVRIHKENFDCKWLMIMSRLTPTWWRTTKLENKRGICRLY